MPPSPTFCLSGGVIAQLVEHLLCKQEAVGSNPTNSTIPRSVRLFFDMTERSSALHGAALFVGASARPHCINAACRACERKLSGINAPACTDSTMVSMMLCAK